MKKIYLLIGISTLLIISSCKKNDPITVPTEPPMPTTPYVPDNSFKVISYFPSYRDPAGVADSKFKMITHLFYAFLNPNTDGSLVALAQPGRFTTLMQKARANGVKTGISISGTKSIFVTMAASATARNLFVKNVLTFVKTNNLDGVDMDWEYPSTSDGSADNYVLLMKELSDSLHKHHKFLSAAITPGVYAGSIRDGLKSEVFPAVDFFNIMVYDGIGWDKNEPFQHASYNMAVASLNYWLGTRGMPKEKAVLGIPAYGKNANNSAKAYRDFVTAGADVSLDNALIDGVQFYFNGTVTTRKKAKLAKDMANGIMFWEFYHDDNGDKSIIRAANDELGRNYN
ncbi:MULTISPECIES: glycosyl hydrolase family 18 protein [unclassified Pedobacter]|uniref:glycosyl hydrolase family 18 protein n=1 Tax=unclassified Pedobacter TaxID=2628915 RepID=UPI0014237394|nr:MULTISPECIES: glycosyl hydrolase family 18 protein [unclassified Pedobacter]NII84445.1 GH18 family chitinase [Pedobacter sp. SG908]NMN38640.1 GH18 family chitinase [Pedobacter sp. SG918]